jgi:hypothetical protein
MAIQLNNVQLACKSDGEHNSAYELADDFVYESLPIDIIYIVQKTHVVVNLLI